MAMGPAQTVLGVGCGLTLLIDAMLIWIYSFLRWGGAVRTCKSHAPRF